MCKEETKMTEMIYLHVVIGKISLVQLQSSLEA